MGGRERQGVERAPASGTILGGRYEVLGLLGAGGMAEVFRVRDRTTGRLLALKVLRAEIATDAQAVERLRREGELLAAIAHPAIVSLETSGTLEDGRVFIAMELLEGETLRERMRRGPMSPVELMPILDVVASGLGAAHQRGIVHRDLKPDNVFLCAQGRADQARVKILDFGVSKIVGGSRLTQTGQIIGTPRYMAPEQLSAERDLDVRVDVYALGVILYEALAGQPPFFTNDPADLVVAVLHGRYVQLGALRVDLPPGLAAVVARAMHRDRNARFATVGELARSFAERARGEGGPARPGMRTDALGSMEAPTPAPDGAARPSGALPATYGELEPGPAPGSAGSAPATPKPARPVVEVPQVRQPVSPPEGERGAGEGPIPGLPQVPRWRWAVGGVTAGVLVALAVLWATGGLGLFAAEPARPPRAPRPAAQPAPPAARHARARPQVRPLPAPPSDPTPAPAPAPAAPRAARGRSTRPLAKSGHRATSPHRHHRRRAARTPTSATSTPAASQRTQAGDTSAAEPAELLRDARADLAHKDYAGCVASLDAALAAGAPASALRLRGDCLLREGNRSAAVAAYRRFCRLVPDHPAIGEVRQIVESLGSTCP